MKPLITIILMLTFIAASAQNAATARAGKKPLFDTADCIETVDRLNNRTNVQLKSGKAVEFRRDSIGRMTLVKIGNESFFAEYDPNFPDRLVGVRQSNNTNGPGNNGALLPIDSEIVAKAVRGMPRTTVQPCSAGELPDAARASKTGVDDETDWYLMPEDDLGGHEYGMGYWSFIHRPYYESAYAMWMDYSPRQNCIDNATACVDVCDNVATKRTYACAVLSAVYFEVPVAAAVAGLLCIMASDEEKDRCKRVCPPLSRCF